jgi:hypothetical protein
MGPLFLDQMKQLQGESSRLKQLVAKSTPD